MFKTPYSLSQCPVLLDRVCDLQHTIDTRSMEYSHKSVSDNCVVVTSSQKLRQSKIEFRAIVYHEPNTRLP